jgi:hypothetical protein
MNYHLCWHPGQEALLWPRGSVVLIRAEYKVKNKTSYTYFISNHFNPNIVNPDKSRTYLLIEEAK